jgi:5,10-methylenetetrahydrofolate reductase
LRASDIVSSGNFLRVVELFPPGIPSPHLMREGQKFDLSQRFDRLVETIASLEAIADAFSLPELKDGDRIHLNSVAVAAELGRRTGSAIIPTITLRDSNRQNILGTVAYGIYGGIENIQVVRGDPYGNAKELPRNVYDYSKVSSLISHIRDLESHLAQRDRLCIIAPINLAKLDDPRYLNAIKKRETSGVDMFVTESMFDPTDEYLHRVQHARKLGVSGPILHSIFPLKSYEDALSIVEKFGWKISNEELSGLKSGGEEYGIEQARKRYQALSERRDLVQGASISTRGNPEVVRLITS